MATTETETTQKSLTTTASCVLLDYNIAIPMHIRTLADFRQWVHSDDFPDFGRIDFLGNRIEVDMSPEYFFLHGKPKSQMARVLGNWIEEHDLGHIAIDSTRISSPQAELSAEPDIVFLSYETLEQNRARLVPKSTGEADRFVEVEGAVDLVVEIVSDSSVGKDTRRLPSAYFDAGVREFWLVDARRDALEFQIHHRGENEFQPAVVDADGFQLSVMFQHRFRLERQPHPRARWKYVLHDAD